MKANGCCIDGLRFSSRHRVQNGGDAYVTPVPSMNPVTVEFNGPSGSGEKASSRLHVATAHRLTFFGDAERSIRGDFVDCRSRSPTRLERASFELSLDGATTIHIPAGVAHRFHGLGGVLVVDEFELFMPHPDRLGETWGASGRRPPIVDLDSAPADLPVIDPDALAASEKLYEFVAAEVEGGVSAEALASFPLAEVFDGLGGSGAPRDFGTAREWAPIEQIDGAGWRRNIAMTRAAESDSGVVMFTAPGMLNVVDHGLSYYRHGAYGIHTCSEDRLTFLGDHRRTARLTMVDCRQGSPTLHAKLEIELHPSPDWQLIIPAGVAHALDDMGGIFTINRPRYYLDEQGRYPSEPGTVNWPLDRDDYPTFPPRLRSPSRPLIRKLLEDEITLMES